MEKYKGWINEVLCYEINAESRGQAYGKLLQYASEWLKKGFRVHKIELIIDKQEKRRKKEETEEYNGQLSLMDNVEW